MNDAKAFVEKIKIKVMKARKKGLNDDWAEVEYVQLRDSYVITKADQMEFDTPTDVKISEEEHWQNVRERAAIAAMQGMLANPELVDVSSLDYRITVEKAAIGYADELVEQLKKKA